MRWLKYISLTILAIILLLVAGIGLFIYQAGTPYFQLFNSWVFKENKVGPVIGDLGGVPVSIPQPIARFVEYENDPHFLEPRKGPRPVRTFQSKLRSFGFEVRFPDMAFLNNEAMREDQRKSNIYNTMWLGVGVDVDPYTDELSLKRLVDAIPAPGKIWISNSVNPPHVWKEKHGYLRSSDTLYGLLVYEVQGYDEAKRYEIPGNDILDANIYYYANNSGHIETYIKCSNIKHDAAPCNHYFILPAAKNTMMKVHYRIGLLPQWREIQDSVGKAILGFAITPTQVESSSKPLTSNRR